MFKAVQKYRILRWSFCKILFSCISFGLQAMKIKPLFTYISPIVDQNKKNLQIPDRFRKFSGWTKGKNNKQIKIDVQKSPNSNCQVSSRYQNTPKAPPSTAPQRIWTWLWTPKWYREMATKLLHETKRRRASIFLAEKTWKHVESIVDHLDFCKL